MIKIPFPSKSHSHSLTILFSIKDEIRISKRKHGIKTCDRQWCCAIPTSVRKQLESATKEGAYFSAFSSKFTSERSISQILNKEILEKKVSDDN